MPQAVPNTEKLDEHLKTVIQALHGAVNVGLRQSKDEKVVDKAILDCKEILDVIMEGNVSEWVN